MPDDPDALFPPPCAGQTMGCAADCDDGRAAACLQIGVEAMLGRRGPTDVDLAATMMDRACRGGLARGCAYRAMYFEPHGSARAAELLEDACEQGYGGGCLVYAARHVLGPDETTWSAAVPWLVRGCAADHALSCVVLGDVERTGAGGRPDATAAAEHYASARRLGWSGELPGRDGRCAAACPQHALDSPVPRRREILAIDPRPDDVVDVRVCVDPSGHVVDVGTSDRHALAELSVATAKRWRFGPGETETTCFRQRFDFVSK